MDWKVNLDTTFSDIWKGRNLRRLLTLWLLSLATLALYGTTTTSLPLPDIARGEGFAYAPRFATMPIRTTYYEPLQSISEPESSIVPYGIETGRLVAMLRFIAANTLTVTRNVSPTIRAMNLIADVCTALQTSAGPHIIWQERYEQEMPELNAYLGSDISKWAENPCLQQISYCIGEVPDLTIETGAFCDRPCKVGILEKRTWIFGPDLRKIVKQQKKEDTLSVPKLLVESMRCAD